MAEFDETLSSLNARSGNISERESQIHIELVFEDDEFERKPCFVAYEASNIIARRKGDRALAIIAEELQEGANENNVVIIHRGIPSNSAARRLFQRTNGYVHIEVMDQGENTVCWDRVFRPQSGKK